MPSVDTWTGRDFPVLRAIVALTEAGEDYIEPEQIEAQTGLSPEAVQLALWALAGEDPPLFAFKDLTAGGGSGRRIGYISNPTGHARRAVGAWPTAESMADQLSAAFALAADREPDPEKRSKLRAAAELGRDAILGVAVTYLAGQIPGR